MKPLIIRKAEDEWAVYNADRPGDYLGSVLRFSATQFSAWPGGSQPTQGSTLDQWFATRHAAAKALVAAL